MKKGKLIDSFGYAIAGVFFCLRHERNMKIHYVATSHCYMLRLLFHITKVEWMILLIVIGIVMSLEMVNTAVEKTVDLATADIHPFAKVAKDVAAERFYCLR
ncbi:diacylglycerol kinase family protein [Bacillus pacificus]